MPHDGDKGVDLKHIVDFTALTRLEILGLMDVTMFSIIFPEDTERMRVRTSLTEVNGMAYGIADTLSLTESLSVFDLVQPSFREKETETIFAIFGNAEAKTGTHLLTKFLSSNFAPTFNTQLKLLDSPEETEGGVEGVPEALRRTFLTLNTKAYKALHAAVQNPERTSGAIEDPLKAGASGVVAFVQDRTLFIANVGSALAVVSRGGVAKLLSTRHDSLDRNEATRIRAAEGWISTCGKVDHATDVSRSFGFYHEVPVIHARPDVFTYPLTNEDEFVILGNDGFWDFVSTQGAVDMARSEWADPMIAAQKLRDFALCYGARGSAMVMVISLSSAFKPRSRLATLETLGALDAESSAVSTSRRGRKEDVLDRSTIWDDVPPPVGHLALVFTELKHSDYLWESNPGMSEAARLHHEILRRELHHCGGYEVKREGDTFMVAFETVSAALLWCLKVQVELLDADWPKQILEWKGGKEVRDTAGNVVMRGLSVKMGIHCGAPVCEPDAITKRMDYFGPMVNRAARVNSVADGGQIMVSADVASEIRARIFGGGQKTEYSPFQPDAEHIIHAVREMEIKLVSVGEVRLKGLEVPETLSLVYPKQLIGRNGLVLPTEEDITVDEEEQDEEDAEEVEGVDPRSIQYLRDLTHECAQLEGFAAQRLRHAPPSPAPSTTTFSSYQTASSSISPLSMLNEFVSLQPVIPEKPTEDQLSSTIDFTLVRMANAASIVDEPLTAYTSMSDSAKIMAAFGARRGQPLGQEKLQKLMQLLDS